ncbi:hypothetical protein [Endozoicomonas sp. ALD040]|uniref:hypothetical protein n=1 Tax=Endozoicomonas sp. ALD040 TaxID=3403079 RepID=UPI003BB0463F
MVCPSVTVDTNGNVGPDSSPDDKRHKPDSQEVQANLIESISWPWRYATNLLVAYELILTTRDASPGSNPHSPIAVEAVFTVGWLLKSYWNANSLLFNPIEQQEASQNHRLAITAVMPGSEQGPPPYQPSESSGQSAPQTSTYTTGYFTSLLFSDSADGDEGPEQHLHTLGLNCYIYPCNGVCRFRQSSDPSDSVEPGCEESSTYDTEETSGKSACSHLASRHCYRCGPVDGVALDGVADSTGAGAASTIDTTGRATCNVILVGEDGQLWQCRKVYKNEKTLLSHKNQYHTGQKTCVMMVLGKNGRSQPCGTLCSNAKALSAHKTALHSRQRTCDVTVIGEDGQPHRCRTLCKSSKALTDHKRTFHTGQQTCDATLVGEDGQKRLCGTVCKNAQTLSNHKCRMHSGKRTCGVTMAGEDGQQQACGKVYKSYQDLRNHIRKDHTGQQTCKETVIGKDGQQRPCGAVYKNAMCLSSHKSTYHSGPKTCDLTLIGVDGRPWPCRKLFNNSYALSTHKRRDHSEPQTCDVTVIGEDGLQRPCGTVCKSAFDLSNHKRRHRKRQLVDVNRNNHLNP